MAKSFIPRVSYKDVDLKDFGGCGKLRVFATSTQVVATIFSNMVNIAVENGMDVKYARDHIDEVVNKYYSDYLKECIRECVYAEDDGKYVKLDEEDILWMDDDLYQTIVETVEEVNTPLVQKDGEGTKNVPSTHSEEA